jgi:hypothetical protein
MLRQDMQRCSGDGASNANIIRTRKERMEGRPWELSVEHPDG